MKFFVAFGSILACAFAFPSYYPAYDYAHAPVTVMANGFLADTQEVSNVRAAHLGAVDIANSAVMPNGFMADTPSVARARAAHLGAVDIANSAVMPNGFMADTPSVARARAAHLWAVAHPNQYTY